MMINEFIELLKNEFDFLESTPISSDSILYDTFGGSSLNLLFLRGIISEHFEVNLTDQEIKDCDTLNDLYKKLHSHLENKPS